MKTNKLLCLILTFMMLFTFTPAFAATDAEAVDSVLAKAAAGTLVDGMTEITSTLTLPAQVEEDGTAVTLTWALAQTELATLSDNCLTVTAVSLTEDLTLPLTVTAVSGDVSKSGSALAKLTVDKGGMPVAPTDPADERYYINEDFTDTTLDGSMSFATLYHGTNNPTTRTTYIDTTDGGRLVFNTKDTSANTTGGVLLKFGMDFSGAQYDGTVFEVDFTLPSTTLDSYVGLNINEKSTSGSASNRATWANINKNGYYYRENSGSTSIPFSSVSLKTTYTNKYVVDFTNYEYDLYIDNVLIGDNIGFYADGGIKSLFLGMASKSSDGTNGTEWSINSVKVYKSGWEDPVSVDAPPAKTYDDSITLDTNDGAITWESSDPSIISIDGATATITRPAIDTDVTLTASKVVGEIKNFKTFTVKVYGNMVPPMDGDYIFNETFDGDGETPMISEGYYTPGSMTSATITGGKLALTGVNNSQNYFYFKSDNGFVSHEGENIRLAYEFEIENTSGYRISTALYGSNRRVDLRTISGSKTIYTSSENRTSPIATPVNAKITVVVDYDNQTYNLYVNGVEVFRDLASANYEVNCLQFTMDGGTNSTSVHTVNIDNIRIYKVGLNLNDKVDADAAAIEAAGIAGVNTLVDGLVESNFAATATVNGSTIKYSSVNGYVNADGTLNRPALTDTDTVTATVYCGTYEKSISFENVKIAGNLVVKELDETASGAQDGKYTAVFPAYTLDGEPKTVTMFVAHYTPDGSRMLAIKYVAAKTINPKGTGGENGDNIVEELLLDGSDISATPNVKAFIWSDEQSISPLPLVK